MLHTRSSAEALALCSVKANGGHAEPAAGISGLLRLCIGLRASAAPPNGQLRTINPHVDAALREVACALPTQRSAAPACGARAGGGCAGGVSSFGYSGTIAHAVLDSGVVGGELRASAASWGEGPRYNRRRFTWLPSGTSRSASASIRLFSTAWASVASEQADERAPDGSRWLLHETAASAWVDRILLAIVAAPCRAALVHSAALSAELALGKWHGMLVAVAPAAARTAPTVDGLCAIVSAARQLRHRRAW